MLQLAGVTTNEAGSTPTTSAKTDEQTPLTVLSLLSVMPSQSLSSPQSLSELAGLPSTRRQVRMAEVMATVTGSIGRDSSFTPTATVVVPLASSWRMGAGAGAARNAAGAMLAANTCVATPATSSSSTTTCTERLNPLAARASKRESQGALLKLPAEQGADAMVMASMSISEG